MPRKRKNIKSSQRMFCVSLCLHVFVAEISNLIHYLLFTSFVEPKFSAIFNH
jgi:hypothetical protein